MPRANLKTTTFDAEELKQALIEYLESTNEFGDFNYEGSAINTIVDLLVRNTTYEAYLANMLANESFIQSAQIRGNVSAHAQKLSYLPNSNTAARITADIEIIPSGTVTDPTLVKGQRGLVFLASVGGTTYSFTTRDIYPFSYSTSANRFFANDVELYQGQYISSNISYNDESIIIPNNRIDISTLSVFVNGTEYDRADSISEFGSGQQVFFLRERTDGLYEIDFGQNVLGINPELNDSINLRYVNAESEHANGVSNLIAASSIDGYSNIQVTVTTKSYGGKDRDDIEFIRFLAPKVYQAQDRALSEFDYIPIVKTQFPFIKSVITWGGETNLPPRYGTVFLSLLTDDGSIITDTLAKIVEQHIRKKMVGSVLPIITTPVFFTMQLDVQYRYNKNKTRKTISEIESYIKQTTFDYSNQEMDEFDGYYNHSELISRIKENDAIESVIIDETTSHELFVYKDNETSYEVNFDNPIVKGSLISTDFTMFGQSSDHKLYDDSNGNVIVSYTQLGSMKTKTLGSIDYETGIISFSAKFTQDANIVTLSVTPEDENFYVRRNNVVNITECNTTEMTR